MADSKASPGAGRQSLVHRFLDPSLSLAEILFGLIMTLTFTLGAGIVIEDEGRDGVRELLVAVIGCNLAWGIIDGCFYILDQIFARGRLQRLARLVREAPTGQAAESLIADELDEQLAEVTGEQDRKELYGRIAARVRAAPLAPTQFRKEDFYGACIVFCLVVLASVPAVLPFLIIDNLKLALRVSNGVLLATLFYVGFAWARHTVARPWMVAMSLVGGGLVLVVAAIALGG